MSTEYAFRVAGRLTPGLLGALDPLWPTGVRTETLLVGSVTDRAALHGLIARIEGLGLELVGFEQLPHHPVGSGRDHDSAFGGGAEGTPHADSASRS